MSGQSATKTKVAVVQAASAIFNAEKTLEKVSKYAKEAADAGAKLVMFPEAFLSAYPHFLDFGKPGTTNPKCRETFKRYYESSVDVHGPIVTQLGNIAKENKIYMVVGAIERDLATLYCVVLFFNEEGEFLGKHRKIVPTTAERLVWGRGDGSTFPVFDWPMGKVGAVICWENYMPLMRVTMYSKGVQIYLAPNADDTDGWLHSMQHIALEGRCFVLACNQFIRKSDYPADLQDAVDCKEDIVCRGGSVIVNPLGEILAGPNYTSEGILYADIDVSDCVRGKFDLDTVGHYSRPDIFTLTVNELKKTNVTIKEVISEPPKENIPQTIEDGTKTVSDNAEPSKENAPQTIEGQISNKTGSETAEAPKENIPAVTAELPKENIPAVTTEAPKENAPVVAEEPTKDSAPQAPAAEATATENPEPAKENPPQAAAADETLQNNKAANENIEPPKENISQPTEEENNLKNLTLSQ